MLPVSSVLQYLILFFAVYIQIFLLVTFFERRHTLPRRTSATTLFRYPSLTVLIPCVNEANTIRDTIDSVLATSYPRRKFSIILIDDGSTDNTLSIMREYETHPSVTVLTKENGGKHSALNMGLEYTTTELVATLDADSFVTEHAFERVADAFTNDKKVQAVVSSILIHQPRNLLQWAQKAEYEMSIFVKNMLACIGGLHVTPGPLSVFRRSVFKEVGGYRRAYNTEDGEMALRLQSRGMRIHYCTDSYVYTVAPKTLAALFKQRVRWTYGFIKNLIDYRRLLFRRRCAGLAFFTMPSAIISFLMVVMVTAYLLYQLGRILFAAVEKLVVGGFDTLFAVDAFSLHLSSQLLLILLLYVSVVITILIGRKMGQVSRYSVRDILSFVVVSGTVAPLWILKSMADAVRSRESKWK